VDAIGSHTIPGRADRQHESASPYLSDHPPLLLELHQETSDGSACEAVAECEFSLWRDPAIGPLIGRIQLHLQQRLD